MLVRVDDEHQIDFAETHFKNLKSLIAAELYGPTPIEDLNKDDIGIPMFKFLTCENSFKLTCNQCSKLKVQLEPMQIHTWRCEKEYNQLLQFLKDLINEAINQNKSLEFTK